MVNALPHCCRVLITYAILTSTCTHIGVEETNVFKCSIYGGCFNLELVGKDSHNDCCPYPFNEVQNDATAFKTTHAENVIEAAKRSCTEDWI